MAVGRPMALGDGLQRIDDRVAQIRRGQHLGLRTHRKDPRRKLAPVAVGGGVDGRAVVGEPRGAVGAEHLLHPPRDGGGEGDLGRLVAVVQLPRRPVAVAGDVDIQRRREVVLGAALEGDAALDARQAEQPDGIALVGVAGHVPVAARVQEAVRVHLALGALVAADGVVREPDGLAPADRRLDLREVRRDVRRVVAAQEVDRHGSGGVVVQRAGTAQREVLQRQPQRLGVGELAVQQVQAGLQRRQLGLVEVEFGQVVVLGRQGVQIALERVVPGAFHRQTQAHALDLGAIGVEAPQECLHAHAAVSLDRLVDLVGGHGPLLCHQERQQRELAHQLVVIPHRHSVLLRSCGPAPGRPMIARAACG